jgi:hypothetical protein
MKDLVTKSLQDSELHWSGHLWERSAVILNSVFVGIGTYQPGWQWSKDIGVQSGKTSERHIGYVVSGKMAVRSATGEEVIVGPGEAFEVEPGHDAWVIGNESCVAMDFGQTE